MKMKFKWVTYPELEQFKNDFPDAKRVVQWHYNAELKTFCEGYCIEDTSECCTQTD